MPRPSLLLVVVVVACSSAPLPGPSAGSPARHAPAAGGEVPAAPTNVAPSVATSAAERVPAEAATAPPPCPPDMVHVRHDYCPDLEHRCVESEYDKSNRITICHEFETGQKTCRGERRLVDVCVDRFEYPNQKGGHPPVMVDFFAAEQRCDEAGKRLCLESEWVAACEGPEEKPFPYGWQRSAEACNIDNRWLEPNLGRVYAKDATIQQEELKRLDQSVPSGSRPGCVSDDGVYDLTGNFDEWVRLDQPKPRTKSKVAGLKGGAWGHVRNACRPVTTSHAPEFTYYFISFRCCRDPNPAAAEAE
ncbi:MAG TPA: SUMF1/EgtB/PvdO family nonheme iron enzyme [Polyangiaceae bacterium]|nr:SUMF1/EgtB/PvdO family nonheme iron enzyme [Polyangiaceae bacterium]